MSVLIEMTGQRFGRLVVLAPAGSKYIGRASRAAWRYRCDCGRVIIVTGAHMREKMTRSCGCLGIEKRYGQRRIEKPARRAAT
jgi:hypothetical protein